MWVLWVGAIVAQALGKYITTEDVDHYKGIHRTKLAYLPMTQARQVREEIPHIIRALRWHRRRVRVTYLTQFRPQTLNAQAAALKPEPQTLV